MKGYRTKKELQDLLWITKYTMAQKIASWEVIEIEVYKAKRISHKLKVYKDNPPFYVYILKKDLEDEKNNN